MLPTTQEYKISLMIGQDSFRTLEGVEVISNPNYPDEPWYSTGGLAIVFKLKLKDKLYALKCFYTEANERQERLGLIAAYLKQNPSPYFVDFTYLEDELWVETDNNEGQGYPVVLMEWVEGKTLDNYLEQICTQNNTPALKNLYFQFCNLAWWLQQQPIAHGDIKHDNLIVTPDGKLKLIDYDGVFVPALRGRKANEMGSPCYQHPKRDAYFFDKNLDDFSLLVLQITLLALQHQPKLFTEHYNGDGIILKDTHYQNFAQSLIKTILWQLPEVKIPLLLSQLQGNINNLNAIDLMPLLQDVAWINWLVGGQKDGKLEFERERLKEWILGDEKCRKLFTDIIAEKYLLSENLIERFENRWDWKKLSRNESLPLSIELIGKYEDLWDWSHLSTKSSLPWSISLLEKYKDKWNWKVLSCSSHLSWSTDLIEKYEDKWKWNWDSLSMSSHLPWSLELIKKYEDKWHWQCLSRNKSLPWSVELLETFKQRWVWKDVSEIKDLPWIIRLMAKKNNNCSYIEDWKEESKDKLLPWSYELIELYKDKWDWRILSSNKALPWSIELIERYEDRWDWFYLGASNSFPWSIELIEKYRNKEDYFTKHNYKYTISGLWTGLSLNPSLPWSSELVEKFENKWNWGELSQYIPWSIEILEKYQNKWKWENLSLNENLPWSIELLEKFKDKWDWKNLSLNEGLPWSIELLEEFKDRWSWGFNGLSRNEVLPWTIELIGRFENKWSWVALSRNESLYWSIELIEKFKDKWVWGHYSQDYVTMHGETHMLSSASYNKGLSDIQNIPWSIELIDSFKDKLHWGKLSENSGIPWSIELIDKFRDLWNWDYLSWYDSSIPWSIELIEQYQDKWNWKELSILADLPCSSHFLKKYSNRLDWSYVQKMERLFPLPIELIEKFKDGWNWKNLTYNEALPWDTELLLKFADKWEWDHIIYNRTFDEKIFKPLLNGVFIEEIMTEIWGVY